MGPKLLWQFYWYNPKYVHVSTTYRHNTLLSNKWIYICNYQETSRNIQHPRKYEIEKNLKKNKNTSNQEDTNPEADKHTDYLLTSAADKSISALLTFTCHTYIFILISWRLKEKNNKKKT